MSANKVSNSMSVTPKPIPAAGSSTQNVEGGKGEAEALASEEVIELQAFLERREWIEEKIRVCCCRNVYHLKN
jgi:hypothetical protein